MNVTYADLSCGIDRVYIYFSFECVLFTHTYWFKLYSYIIQVHVLTVNYVSLVFAHNLLGIVFVRWHHRLWKVPF